MGCVRAVLGSVLLVLSMAGCASPPPSAEGAKLAFAGETTQLDLLKRPGESASSPYLRGGLAGRTIRVSRLSDIRLGPREVVLTFDDGPMPGKTAKILDTLDLFGVKATFLMVGQMARAYPDLVRKVAARGHTIGSHTENHANLRGLGSVAAARQIDRGRASIDAALGPSRRRAAPFFRFPYLADTPALRASLAAQGIVVIDSDIDSKDYFQSSPDQLRRRTMERIAARGSGIVLMHDIHARSAAMLPGLLADLKARGYRVVHLAPGSSRGPEILVSQAD